MLLRRILASVMFVKLELQQFYKLLVRPTVVISTISAHGISNAAPFSWNSPMATKPEPLFGFCSGVTHDTWRNIKENKEFVVNMVGEDFGPLMEIMERDFPYEVSEIKECGLTEIKAYHIKPPRIKEAFGWLECRMINHISLSERNVWIIGAILEAEVKREAYKDVVDVAAAKPLNHIWGEAFVKDMKITKYKRA
jgi:flavin reductase (DIM6/NTAB) family NADH-FMN oxidoreductase RutF